MHLSLRKSFFRAVYFFFLIACTCSQEENERAQYYRKTQANPLQSKLKGFLHPSANFKGSSSDFADKAQVLPTSVGQPCEDLSNDPCQCSLTNLCIFDEFTERCISTNLKFSGQFLCQRKGSFYAYGTKTICQSPSGDSGHCNGKIVYSVNLNGATFKSSESVIYKAEAEVIKLDLERFSIPGTASCNIVDADTKDGKHIYASFIEGNPETREEGACVSYPVPILQDGEHEIIIKTLAETGRCLDIKIGGASVVVDADLMELSENQNCKAIDIVVPFFVEEGQTRLHIKGHQNPISIGKGLTLKFCFAVCEQVPYSVFRASAFTVIRYGKDTKVFDNMEMRIQTYGDGMQMFTYNQISFQEQKSLRSKISPKTTLRKLCPKISNILDCKKFGCEYNLAKEICSSAETFCSGTVLGAVQCYRRNSLYVSGGVLCQTNLEDQGTCSVDEVKFAVNLYGKPYQGPRGILYASGKKEAIKLSASNTNLEFIDLEKDADVVCSRDPSTKRLRLGGAAILDSGLFSTMVRCKKSAPAGNCINFPISNIGDGSYELSISTMEPYYKQKKKRAFTIKINEQTIVKNMDIFEYAGSCNGIAIVIQFQIFKGDTITVTGFPPGVIRDGKIVFGLCQGDDPAFEDLGFIVSAVYLAKLRIVEKGGKLFEDKPLLLEGKSDLMDPEFDEDQRQSRSESEDSIDYKTNLERKSENDTETTEEEQNLSNKCPEHKTTYAPTDIYFEKNGSCSTYTFPFCQDGTFHLSFEIEEDQVDENTCYDMYMEKKIIWEKLDSAELEALCYHLQLSFPMNVEHLASLGIKMMHVSGMKNLMFTNTSFNVSLCNCHETKKEHQFIVSHIFQTDLKEGAVNCTLCRIGNGDSGQCDALGCFYNSTTKLCTARIIEEEDPCQKYSDSPNECKMENCQYNFDTYMCEPSTVCQKDEDFSAYLNCRRPNAYYSTAGSLCLNKNDTEATGACSKGQPIWAVNLNGNDFTNGQGTLFSAEEPLHSFDPAATRVGVNIQQYCEETDVEFMELYSTGVLGSSEKKMDDSCLNYPIPICQDGAYELSLFFVEGHYENINERCFDVKLNSVTVAYALDLVRLGAELSSKGEATKCKRSKIIVPFIVSDSATAITPLGYSTSSPIDGNVHLSVCFGKCGYADPVFQLTVE